MGMFDGLNSATGTRGGNYFAAGTYECEVEKFSAFKSTTSGALCVAIEAKITSVLSSQPGDEEYAPSNREGEVCSQVIIFDGKWRDTKLGNLKNFLAAVLQHDETDAAFPWEETAEKLSGGDGTELKGAKVTAIVPKKRTKAGKAITPPVWRAPEA